MKRIVLFFLIAIFLSQSTFALSKDYYQERFNQTKKEYLSAIMSANRSSEIEALKKLVKYGTKLNLNTSKYQKELNRLDGSSSVTNPASTKSYLTPPKKVASPKSKRYTIKSVTQTSNSVIITFNKNINKTYIDFFERRDRNYFYDEFDIKGTFKDASPTKLKMDGVNKITIYQKNKNILRILFRDRSNLSTIYIILKNKIIIKVLGKGKKVPPKKDVKLLQSDIFYPSAKTIVIDAGHGGKDAGAVGRGKLYEKNIVYNISKYVKYELRKSGFKVYLTRTRDKYVELSSRTKYANKKKADLFISIHANAVPRSKAHRIEGVETFFLSPARSERAKRAAALENKGDMKKMGWSSKNSLLTILNRSKITASNKAAIDVQKNMLHILRKKYGKKTIKDGGVREGPFWVLVGAQMPSILIEVGYITHPKERKRLASTTYQKLIAKGIANGVKSYFVKNSD